MKVGDELRVYSDGPVLYLHLELKYSEEPINPLFHYLCPSNSAHKLHLFYPEGAYLNPYYLELIKKNPENGCGHDLKHFID